LFQIDPSGAFYEWKATAIGRNSKNAKIFLEKRYSPEIEIEDVKALIRLSIPLCSPSKRVSREK